MFAERLCEHDHLFSLLFAIGNPGNVLQPSVYLGHAAEGCRHAFTPPKARRSGTTPPPDLGQASEGVLIVLPAAGVKRASVMVCNPLSVDKMSVGMVFAWVFDGVLMVF